MNLICLLSVLLQCCTVHSKERAYYTVPHLSSQQQNYDNAQFLGDDVASRGTYNVIEHKYGRTSAAGAPDSIRKERPVDVDVVQLSNDFFRANEPQDGARPQADQPVEEVQLQEVFIHKNSAARARSGDSFNERPIDVHVREKNIKS